VGVAAAGAASGVAFEVPPGVAGLLPITGKPWDGLPMLYD